MGVRRHLRAQCLISLLLLGCCAALASLQPRTAAAASGCSRETGSPTTSDDGIPACGGFGDGCYYCEYSNPDGGYTICSEDPDPGDDPNCVDTPQLPGRLPQNRH